MVSITVHGGAGQIGGNKILLEDRDTRIFLDFGEPFGLLDDYFVDFLSPREGRFGLRDYFHFKLMPRIKGVYDEEYLEDTDLTYVPPEFDAIFISHMHFDHSMHLRFADRNIPVYLGATANAIRRSWTETSLGKVKFGEHEFREFRTGSKIKVGSIEVEPIHVDHSTPGAYGFIVHTSEGAIAYTGDLRLHGPRGDMTEDFVARASSERPIAMICEGTRVSESDPRENMSEVDVGKRARELVSSSDKLAIVSFYPKDVDRIRTFRDVAKATGRKFVVSAKVAHMLKMLQDDEHIDAPDPMRDSSMLVYVRRMANMDRVKYEKVYAELLEKDAHVVDSDYVRKHQAELMMHTDFFQLTELIDIQPKRDSLFIRSKSEPFEEDDIQEEVLQNWVNWFGLDFRQAHASGHASMSEIFSIIDRVSPGVVIPVHTEHPELFARCKSCRSVLPRPGNAIPVGKGAV
ncbi:MAG: MBL fold metallo-hydrolase [Candidatus Thermoplasmatota archaeon]|nr:MBL fold metallo-hydrolase [Candidatus Thermoplasmatota archaeon]